MRFSVGDDLRLPRYNIQTDFPNSPWLFMALLLRQTFHFLLLLLLLLLFQHLANAVQISTEFLYPNFSASSIGYIEKDNVFLTSRSSAFSAILSSDSPQSPFVFSILHTPSSTIVWSANFASPAPYTSVLSLSSAGLSIALSNGSLLWFTPRFPRPIAALRLLDSGNLLLLDDANNSLWQSFEHPTDTLLSSQRLPVGASLSTASGDYRLLVTADDVVLFWVIGDQQYWRLSSDLRSVKYFDDDDPASYMASNESGLFLLSAAGRALYVVKLPRTNLKFMKLESDGRFHLMGYSGDGSRLTEELVAPISACDLPLSCGAIGVCTLLSRGVACNCLTSFAESADGGCSPADSFALATLSNCATEPSYRRLEGGIEYFANKFLKPASSGGNNVSSCRGLCTANCSCLGFFYKNSSASCFLVNKQIGSFLSPRSQGGFDSIEGYIKIMAQSQLDSGRNRNLVRILLPSMTVLLALLFAGIYWRRGKRISRSRKSPKFATLKLWTSKTRDDSISDESDEISIPDLPTRFTYAELIAATNNFRTKIGSGGFGEVFKGDLPDKSSVAVKRIKTGSSGIQGKKKEFITEIAVIGSIHHVNLVRLRGFCADGRRRLLVYDYMDRGSLDQSLFVSGGRPVLEWKERMDIAVGVARGLAYLHSGCDRKVIHCDVKPENILLHSSGGVKISDFGMAKLMSTDQSGLFTTMRGTRGYLAPEWLTNSAISDKTDVYSFGLVLLEIIRGRRNWSMVAEGWSIGEGDQMGYYPMIALEKHEKGRYLELADPRLEGKMSEEELGRVVRVALCCLHEEPAMRPTMDGVAAMLDGTMEVGEPRTEALGVLRVYGRGFLCSGESCRSSRSSSSSSRNYSGLSYPYLSSQEVSGPR